jgi:RsiW-degrading membrane proteinase PrsW (M82 family)
MSEDSLIKSGAVVLKLTNSYETLHVLNFENGFKIRHLMAKATKQKLGTSTFIGYRSARGFHFLWQELVHYLQDLAHTQRVIVLIVSALDLSRFRAEMRGLHGGRILG